MGKLRQRIESMGPMAALGAGGAAILVLLLAIVGAIKVSHHGSSKSSVAARGAATTTSSPGALSPVTGGQTAATQPGGAPVPGGAASAGGAARSSGGQSVSSGGTRAGASNPNSYVSPTGGDTTGVFKDHVEWGLHAPKTFNGAPLPIADDPLKGVKIYLTAINNAGGVAGRKIVEEFADDSYTVDGAKAAANTLINDKHVFHISGTLGVDQIAIVAAAAAKAHTPYMAGGGSEVPFRTIGMYQEAGSYDTHLVMLAKFLAKESTSNPASPYFHLKRIGVSALNSVYLQPSVDAFHSAVDATGVLEWGCEVKVAKYTDSSNTHNYSDQLQTLQNNCGGTGKHADIVVPAQDPLTTQLQVQQCPANGCTFKWTMSDFAHDDDVALGIIEPAGQWNGVRGLSGGCYYEVYKDPKYDGKCGNLKQAHDAWIAGTDASDKQGDWDSHGQGGVAGYQITHFWLTALKNAGADLTRQRFVSALSAYKGFDDLVTGPITFAGSPNIAHGIDEMAVYQAQADGKWTQASDGLVGSF